jgi:hypothetical protein
MKYAKFLFILTAIHLNLYCVNVYGADYPRPQFSGQKKPVDFSKLPQALLSDGQPVDPFCVAKVLMMARGSSVALTECAGSATDVQSYLMHTNNAEKKVIIAEAKIDNRELGHIDKCKSRYEVQGVFGKKAIVKTKHDCDATYGQRMTLGLIEQKNNLLINAGVLSEGNECTFGYSYVESLEKGILRYRVMSPVSQIFTTLLNRSLQGKFYPSMPDHYEEDIDGNSCFGWLHLTVNLNKDEDPFKPELIKITFKRPYSFGYPETKTKNCLLVTLDKFFEENDPSIPAEKFSAFRAEVKKCIDLQPPKPKEYQRVPGFDI